MGIYIVGFIVGLLLLLVLLAQIGIFGKPKLNNGIDANTIKENETLKNECSQLKIDLAGSKSTIEATYNENIFLKEQLQQAQQKLEKEIDTRKQEIDSKNKNSLEHSKEEGKVLEAIAPVSVSLNKMEQKISELEKQRIGQYSTIEQALNKSFEQQKEITKTTSSLTNALQNNQTRGVWGETQLKTIVEATGMLNHIDFETQKSVSFTDEKTPKRPDMIIYLPENRSIVVDSKAPFNNYYEACQVAKDDVAKRDLLLAEHAKSLKIHIDKLSSKEYWDMENKETVDFTIMFMPSESMLSSAIQTDSSLLEYAFSKRIALASPVSFFSVLKTISFVWQQHALNENALEIGKLGKDLLERIREFSKRYTSLGDKIKGVVKDYNQVIVQVESKVFNTASTIAKKLDSIPLESNKEIDSEQATIRTFKKQELIDD